jgi:hypothetical protein
LEALEAIISGAAWAALIANVGATPQMADSKLRDIGCAAEPSPHPLAAISSLLAVHTQTSFSLANGKQSLA